MDTSHLQVMRPPTDDRIALIPGSRNILNPVEITINGYEAHVLIDSCTINGDLISANFCLRNKITTEDMDAKPLETAIKGRRSTMTKKADVELNIQGNKISISFYVPNLTDWHSTLGQPLLATLNVIMDVKNNQVSIQPIGKSRQ